MIYEYSCEPCNILVDVSKPVAEFDRIEHCAECKRPMQRAFAPRKLHLYNTGVQEKYFSQSLGQVVRGNNHERQIAKERGLIEVGNERPEKHVKMELDDYSGV